MLDDKACPTVGVGWGINLSPGASKTRVARFLLQCYEVWRMLQYNITTAINKFSVALFHESKQKLYWISSYQKDDS